MQAARGVFAYVPRRYSAGSSRPLRAAYCSSPSCSGRAEGGAPTACSAAATCAFGRPSPALTALAAVLRPLAERRADGAEHGPFALRRHRRRRVQRKAQHRACHLRRRVKAARLHAEQHLRARIVVHGIAHRACPARAGQRGQALGGLPLHHYGDVLQRQPVLQQLHHKRACDIIRQIGAHRHLHARKLLADKGGKVQLQSVALHDADVGKARQRLGQQSGQAGIQLYGHHPARAQGQLFCQHADAGAYLQHAICPVDAAGLHNFRAHAGVHDEILPQPLRQRKAVRRTQAADDSNVRQLHRHLIPSNHRHRPCRRPAQGPAGARPAQSL